MSIQKSQEEFHEKGLYVITEDIILKYGMKDEFPQVFTLPSDFTGWCKLRSASLLAGEAVTHNPWMMYFKKGFAEYGINSEGDWLVPSPTNTKRSTIMHKYREATIQEIEEALTKEAVKRGFKEGSVFKNEDRYHNFTKFIITPNIIWSKHGGIIFCEGVWAEVVQTMTKKQAEEKLNCIIVI